MSNFTPHVFEANVDNIYINTSNLSQNIYKKLYSIACIFTIFIPNATYDFFKKPYTPKTTDADFLWLVSSHIFFQQNFNSVLNRLGLRIDILLDVLLKSAFENLPTCFILFILSYTTNTTS